MDLRSRTSNEDTSSSVLTQPQLHDNLFRESVKTASQWQSVLTTNRPKPFSSFFFLLFGKISNLKYKSISALLLQQCPEGEVVLESDHVPGTKSLPGIRKESILLGVEVGQGPYLFLASSLLSLVPGRFPRCLFERWQFGTWQRSLLVSINCFGFLHPWSDSSSALFVIFFICKAVVTGCAVTGGLMLCWH